VPWAVESVLLSYECVPSPSTNSPKTQKLAPSYEMGDADFCVVIDRRRLQKRRYQPPRLRKLHLEHVRAGTLLANLLLLRARPVRRPARQRLHWHLRAERPARRVLPHRYCCYSDRWSRRHRNWECCCNDGGGQYVDEYVGWRSCYND
jgi:hypothetical protein